MFPWFWIWAPQWALPLSGDVAQAIEPDTDWFFGAIPPAAGVGAVEKRAFEVASYGRQLGLITEVLLDAAERTAPQSADGRRALERLRDIHARIGAVKREQARVDEEALAAQLERLRAADPDAFARITGRLALAPAAR